LKWITESRIGFISTRLAGTDGVSLETIRWSNILADYSYELGRRHYSYRTLEKRLVALISECLGD
jgi:hypothetical protein